MTRISRLNGPGCEIFQMREVELMNGRTLGINKNESFFISLQV